MKKEYIAPTMKVRTVRCSHMLCGSVPADRVDVFYDESVDETDETTGKGIAW